MKDNLDRILPLLKFESEDDFYFLQILQRKKENDLLTANSRVIKNYYVKSQEQLTRDYPEIISLCKQFNARASLRLNKRSFEQTAFHALGKISNTILNKDFSSVRKSYDRVCGQFHNDLEKKWIVDVDNVTNRRELNGIITFIDKLAPDGYKFITLLETKSGFHIITKPFNVQDFKKEFPDIEIHKDNPVNLFIP